MTPRLLRSSPWPRIRGDDPRTAGWATAVVVAPHLVLGTWLLAVPDHIAFRTSQIVTLVHVVLAVLTLPLVALWIGRHWRRMVSQGPAGGWWAAAERRAFVATVILAFASGALVAWGGRIASGHSIHAWCGLAIGAAMSVHLWRARRRAASFGVAALLVLSAFGAWAARVIIAPEPAPSDRELFQSNSSAAYQPASYCGECHVQEYAEWSRSTHGRTMVHRLIKADMESHPDELGFNLADFGALAKGRHLPHDDMAVGACQRCHAPTDFYGDNREDPRHPQGVAEEGITCSFCHSVRAVYEGVARGRPLPAVASPTDWPQILPRFAYYVSAPQDAHRYLGEGSRNRVARWIANALIRWRPAMHSADNEPPLMRTAQACMPCHSGGDFDSMPDILRKTYYVWEQGQYATSDPETKVVCQDCHMASKLTGLRSHERGPFVPWGPDRDGRASHLFLGGHTTIANVMNDEELEAREHEMNRSVVELSIVDSRLKGDLLEVDVRVASKMVAHLLPAMETQARFLWVEVSAHDGTGNVLATTPTPRSGADAGGATPVMFRCPGPRRVECDTALHPHEPRVFTAQLPLPAGSRPATLDAVLHLSIDHRPLAEASVPFPVAPMAR